MRLQQDWSSRVVSVVVVFHFSKDSHNKSLRMDHSEAVAQDKLVQLLRQERNDAISSLSAAKAELEIAREDLEAVLRKKQKNSPSASRPSTSGRNGYMSSAGVQHQHHHSPNSMENGGESGGASTLDRTVYSLLHAARQRQLQQNVAAFQQTQQVPLASSSAAYESSSSPARRVSGIPLASHHQQQVPTTVRRLDDEVAAHLELTNRQVSELERRVERYETEVQTALTRNEELQLRLDASLLREKTLSERNALLDEDLAATKRDLSETASAMEMLKLEATKLFTRLNSQLDIDSQLEHKVQQLENDNRRLSDEAAKLRVAEEHLRHHVTHLETDVAAMRATAERREEDMRQKIVVLGKELASVREQRDQALRPYHARHVASNVTPLPLSPAPTSHYASPPPPSSAPAHPSAASPSSSYNILSLGSTTASGLYSGGQLMNSPPASFRQPATHPADDVMELKRQVQWLLERSGGK